MEKLVRKQVMEHLNVNKLLTDSQYGFRNKRSTVLQLLKVLDHWTEILDDGNCLDVLYLDFSKAFDTVPHCRLTSKLQAHGIQGSVLEWITDFLTGRKQRVSINGSLSEWLPVRSGIPQGSVLGPVLFIIYINDLPDLVKNFAMLFADDTKIYAQVNNEYEHRSLQDDLSRLMQWSEKWQLSFNAAKCKVLHYGRNNRHFEYSMGNGQAKVTLQSAEEEKDLGVIFTTDLKFSRHIATAANKANRIVGIIRRSFRYLDKPMLAQLYKSLIRSHLEYANTVWCPMKQADIDHLERVQRRATKLITVMKDLSYPERLRTLKLPTLVYRRARGDMIEVYKILHNLVDSTDQSPLHLADQGATRGHSFKLQKRYCRTALRAHAFSQRVVDKWNSLPEAVVSSPTLNAFKNSLDRHWSGCTNLYNYRD